MLGQHGAVDVDGERDEIESNDEQDGAVCELLGVRASRLHDLDRLQYRLHHNEDEEDDFGKKRHHSTGAVVAIQLDDLDV